MEVHDSNKIGERSEFETKNTHHTHLRCKLLILKHSQKMGVSAYVEVDLHAVERMSILESFSRFLGGI